MQPCQQQLFQLPRPAADDAAATAANAVWGGGKMGRRHANTAGPAGAAAANTCASCPCGRFYRRRDENGNFCLVCFKRGPSVLLEEN